jgi:hypothetical protein
MKKEDLLNDLREKLSDSTISQAEYQHILDFLESKKGQSFESIEDIISLSKEWKSFNDNEINKGRSIKVFDIYDIEVYHLQDNQAFIYEGSVLNHCVGNYKIDSHPLVFSIRKNDIPKYTLEISEQGVLLQLYGFQNSIIRSKDFNLINEILEKFFIKKGLVKLINKNIFCGGGYLQISRYEKRFLENHFNQLKIVKLLNQDFLFLHNKISIKKQFDNNILKGNLRKVFIRLLAGANKINILENTWLHFLLNEEEYSEILKLKKGVVYSNKNEYFEWFTSKKINIYDINEHIKIFLTMPLNKQYGNISNIYEYSMKMNIDQFLSSYYTVKDSVIKENFDLLKNVLMFKSDYKTESISGHLLYYLLKIKDEDVLDLTFSNLNLSTFKIKTILSIRIYNEIIKLYENREYSFLFNLFQNIYFDKSFSMDDKFKAINTIEEEINSLF